MHIDNNGRARSFDLVRRLITGWALLGGVVLVGVTLVNAYSIVAGAVVNKPFPGDFELTEMGSAIAAFCFLPYCQLIGANEGAPAWRAPGHRDPEKSTVGVHAARMVEDRRPGGTGRVTGRSRRRDVPARPAWGAGAGAQ